MRIGLVRGTNDSNPAGKSANRISAVGLLLPDAGVLVVRRCELQFQTHCRRPRQSAYRLPNPLPVTSLWWRTSTCPQPTYRLGKGQLDTGH